MMHESISIKELITQLESLREDVGDGSKVYIQYGLPGEDLYNIAGAILSIYKPTGFKTVVLCCTK